MYRPGQAKVDLFRESKVYFSLPRSVNKSYSRETSLVTPYSQTSESYGAKNIYVENEVVSRVVRRS